MIAPTRLESKLDNKPITESFIVVNRSEDKVKIGVEPILFSEETKGKDISKYISVNPKVVSLAAGKSRVIRVTVKPSPDIKGKTGEYYGRIMFKTLEKEKKEGKEERPKNSQDVGMKIDLIFNISIPVYVSIGTGTPEVKAQCFIDKDGPKVKVENKGLWRFDGYVTLYGKNKESELAKERVMVTRQNSKDVALKLKAENIGKDAIPLAFTTIDKEKKVTTLTDNCIFTKYVTETPVAATSAEAKATKPSMESVVKKEAVKTPKKGIK
jgi:P pilus assembly chaperone PapD